MGERAHPFRGGGSPAAVTYGVGVSPNPLEGLATAKADQDRIERTLLDTVRINGDAYLTEIASHLIKAGGKRLRPAFCFWGFVGAGGDPGVQGDPADVPAHHLGDHAPVVGLTGGAEPVHGIGGDGHRGVEADGAVGPGDVVVDRLGDRHDPHARLGDLARRMEGAVPADADEGVDALGYTIENRRLGEARAAARSAGYRGAMFPWQSGSDGREETQQLHLNPRSGRWLPDESHRQRHVNLAIAYNVWRYFEATGDGAFLAQHGAEIILEIARFWASVAKWNSKRERYDICNVLGPDEFHDRYPGSETPGLNNNAYTNVMAAWCLVRALDVLEILPDERCRELRESLQITGEEIERWDEVSRKLYLPLSDEGMLWQFEGYDALKEFDWEGYRERYDNIMRLDLILEDEGDSPNAYKLSKQADVLMVFYLLPSTEVAALFERLGYDFDPEIIPTTIDYYLQRTSHGSTLSGVVHAWVLARSERTGSWPLFLQALRSDIEDIQGGTTAEGIHLGAMAGTGDILLRCYTGLVLHTDELRFHPVLPDEVTRLSFDLRYRGHSLTVDVTRDAMTVASAPVAAGEIALTVRNQMIVLQPGERRSIPLTPP